MKTALITGGSRGIGWAIVEEIAALGYQIAFNGVRDESAVESQLLTLKKMGINACYCQGDIGKAVDREKIVNNTVDKFGSIDVLVSNAGVAPRIRNDIMDLNEEEYDYVMDINLKGTFFLSQLVAKHMIEHNQPTDHQRCMIFISSVSANVASLSRSAYCISKAGVSMLTKLMAIKLAEIKIPVYEIQPGIIKTDMTALILEKYQRLVDSGLTLEKRLGEPEDIGKIVGALVNEQIPYSTGQVFIPDGGFHVERL